MQIQSRFEVQNEIGSRRKDGGKNEPYSKSDSEDVAGIEELMKTYIFIVKESNVYFCVVFPNKELQKTTGYERI